MRRKSKLHFLRRIRRQGRHLEKHLRGRYQKTFYDVREALKPLRPDARKELNAHNPYARSNFFRAVVDHLCNHLGAKPPHFITSIPVFFVTIIDGQQIIYPDDCAYGEPKSRSLNDISRAYSGALLGLNYIGMLDFALYVSAQRTHGVSRFINVHVHALVWGITEKALKKFCKDIREGMSPLLSYATSVDCQPVRYGDLLQVIWYTTKAPRSQYQLWTRTRTGTLKQWNRAINGVNSVRLYAALERVKLDQLALSGGDGMRLLERSLRDARLHPYPGFRCARQPRTQRIDNPATTRRRKHTW